MSECLSCGVPHHGERARGCPERCLSCGGEYGKPKPADCTGSHSWAGDVKFLLAHVKAMAAA